MAITQVKGVWTVKDSEGNLTELYPAGKEIDKVIGSQMVIDDSRAGALKINKTFSKSKQRKLTGAQLANLPDLEETERYGIVWSCKNGIVTAKGIATSTSSTRAVNCSYSLPIVKGNYAVSGGNENGIKVVAAITLADDSVVYKTSSFSLDGTEKECHVYCQVQSGVTVNATIYPMLNAGSEALPWEPYIGAGENLMGTDFQSSENNGITFTVNGNKSITTNGTATAVAAFQMFSTLPPGKYVVSGCPAGSGCSIEHKKDNASGTLLASENGTGFVTFTIDEKTTICSYIRIPSGTVCNNLVFYPRIYLETPTPAPNPQYPQPVVNMGQKIVDGWQLFDKDNAFFDKGASTSTGSLYNAPGLLATNFIPVSGLSAIAWTGETNNGTNEMWGAFYDNNKNFLTKIDVKSVKTISVPTGAAYAVLTFTQAHGVDTIMVNAGSTAKPWEPYTCGGYTDGSQLFDIGSVTDGILNHENGTVSYNNTWLTTDFIPVNDTDMTASVNNVSDNFIVRFVEYDSQKTFLKNTTNIAGVNGNTTGTVRLSSQTKYVRLSFGFNNRECTKESYIASGNRIMLNRGSVAKAWQPYTAGMKPVVDIPIETEVVNNLFNEKYTPYVSGLVRNSNGTIKAYADYPNNRTYYLPITPGETYTVVNNNNSAFLRVATSEVIPADGVVATNTNADTSVSTATITAGANDRYLLIWPRATTGTVSYDDIVSGLVVTVGSTAQPYIKQLLTINKPGGFAGIPVTDASLANFTDEDGQMYCCDERDWEQEIYVGNMLENTAKSQTVSGVTFTVNEDGSITANGIPSESYAQIVIGYVNCKANVPYTMSGCPSGGTNKYWLLNSGGSAKDYGNGATILHTTDVSSHAIALRIETGTVCNNLTFYPMIRPVEIDGVPTSASYVPYSGGVFKKMYGVDVQRIGRTVFDGSADEAWVYTSNSSIFYANLMDAMKILKESGGILCDHYMFNNMDYYHDLQDKHCTLYPDGNNTYPNKNWLYLRNTDYTTVEGLIAALQANPITVQYILATPIYRHVPEEEAAARRALMANEPSTTIISDAPHEIEYGTSRVGAVALGAEMRAMENELKIQENEAKDIELEAKLIKLEEEPNYSTRLDNINILDVVENGKYFAVGCTGSPSGSVGYLEVHNHPSAADKYRKITWSPYENGNITFQNIMVNGTWTGWTRFLTVADITASGDTVSLNWL